MWRFREHWLGFAAMLLVLAGCGQAKAPSDRLVLGQSFPTLEVTSLDGETLSLPAARGKLVVLNVWATWCPPCRKELPSLQRLSRTLDSQRFAVLGLALDEDAHVVREYLIDKGVDYPNWLDPALRAADDVLGITAYPYTFFIGPQGEVLGRVVGEARWDAPEVIEALEAAYRGDASRLAGLARRS